MTFSDLIQKTYFSPFIALAFFAFHSHESHARTDQKKGHDTYFSGDKPVDAQTRNKRLSPFFSPAPMSEDAEKNRDTPDAKLLKIPFLAYRDLVKNADISALKGEIKVTPPKGICFTITKNRDVRDIRVCKEEFISFRLDDLSPAGTLTWSISTGSDDTGTILSWQTPHRVALAISINVPSLTNADSIPEFINTCTTFNDDNGRRIHLKLFDGRLWAIRFPDRDIKLPQPPPPPNLYVSAKNELNMQAKKSSKADNHKEEEAAASKSDPHKSEAPKAPEASSTPAPSSSSEGSFKEEPGLLFPWTVTASKSFGMSSSFFMPEGLSTPGILGSCRYKFTDPQHAPVGGILECQNAPGVAYILVPLACSGAFESTAPKFQ